MSHIGPKSAYTLTATTLAIVSSTALIAVTFSADLVVREKASKLLG